MFSGYIVVESFQVGDITIEPQYIRGEKLSVSPFIVFPCMSNLNSHIVYESEQAYSIISLTGELFFVESQHMKFKIANFNSGPLMHRSSMHGSKQSFSLSIPVDYYGLKRLEEKRKGDMHLEFQFTMLMGKHATFLIKSDSFNDNVASFHKIQSTLILTVPKSNWVENVLNNTGFHEIKLIEVPIPKKIIPQDVFQKALLELDRANKYYYDGDYNKASLHCRMAIETIPESLPYDTKEDRRGYSKRLGKFMEQYLNQTIPEDKRKLIHDILNGIYSICSEPGHPSQEVPITRNEAEFYIIICSAFLAYVGKSIVSIETHLEQN